MRRLAAVLVCLWAAALSAQTKTATMIWDGNDPSHQTATLCEIKADGQAVLGSLVFGDDLRCVRPVPAAATAFEWRLTNPFGSTAWYVPEVCGNNKDDDGDQAVDEFCGSAAPSLPTDVLCIGARWTIVNGEVLRNGAGTGGLGSVLKCVDNALWTYGGDNRWWRYPWDFAQTAEPGGTTPAPPPVEVCGDAIDNDGDGQIDEGCPPPPSSSLLFDGGFETGDFSAYFTDTEGDPSLMSKTTTANPVTEGLLAARFTLTIPDTTFPIMRNEIFAPEWNATPGFGAMGQEYVYAFSHFIPTTWPDTALPIEVGQFHVAPDGGEVWRQPVLAFLITNGHWDLVNRWDENVISQFGTANDTIKTIDLGHPQVEKGVWTKWRVQVRWSWGDPMKPQGYLKIWKNDVLIVDRVGPNCYNDGASRVFKWGIYTRSDWTSSAFPVASYSLVLDGLTASSVTGPVPPPVLEVCGDGIDNDRDGLIDEGCAPPPPPDVCVTDPLVISGIKWPAQNVGSRSLTFSSGTKRWATFGFLWRTDGHHALTVTDVRGCVQTVTK